MIDLSALFSQLFATLGWLLPLFVLVALFKLPWFKCLIGEKLMNLSARLFLDNNVTIPTEDASSCKGRKLRLQPALIAMEQLRIYSAGYQHPPRLSLKRIFGGFFYA